MTVRWGCWAEARLRGTRSGLRRGRRLGRRLQGRASGGSAGAAQAMQEKADPPPFLHPQGRAPAVPVHAHEGRRARARLGTRRHRANPLWIASPRWQ
jgi:hypothetical protein